MPRPKRYFLAVLFCLVHLINIKSVYSENAVSKLKDDNYILFKNSHINTEDSERTAIPKKLRSMFSNTYVIQFTGDIKKDWLDILEKKGINLVSYIPNNAYVVKSLKDEDVLALDFVSWVGPYEAYYKMSAELIDRVIDEDVKESDLYDPEFVQLDVIFFPGEEEEAIEEIENLIGSVLEKYTIGCLSKATVIVPAFHISQVAKIEGVQWIEPKKERVMHNDLAKNYTNLTSLLQNHSGLTGTGVIVNVNDTGVDDTHPAFAQNPALPTSYPGNNTRIKYVNRRGDGDGHGTHTSGSVLGNGALSDTVNSAPGSPSPYASDQFAGMAPNASLVMLNIFGSDYNDYQMIGTAYSHGARVSSNSWGYNGFMGPVNIYDGASATWDAGVRDASYFVGEQSFLVFFSAGNDGWGMDNGLGGLGNTIGTPGTAKNIITVGAYEEARFADNMYWTSSNDDTGEVAGFSSRGPVAPDEDGVGMFKPDIVAPGVYVLSTQSAQQSSPPDSSPFSWDFKNGNVDSGDNYEFMSGTSMSCPVAAGLGTLVYQYCKEQGLTPSPALCKALIINGARSISSKYDFNTRADIVYQGWGGINLDTTINGPNGYDDNDDVVMYDQGELGYLEDDQEISVVVPIKEFGNPLRITLVWTDYPGSPAADIALVNNLDLEVTAPDGTTVYKGNNFAEGSIWSSPDGEFDYINNVENVYIEVAFLGDYTVKIIGRSINADSCSASPEINQDFALVCSGDMGFQLIPFGRIFITEKVCNPGESVTIIVSDADLSGDGTCTVEVTTDTVLTPEVITLNEVAGSSGNFMGSVTVSDGAVVDNDGIIQYSGGDTITFKYIDEDDGLGHTDLERTASCYGNVVPVFSGIESLVDNETDSTITIFWQAAVDQESPIEYMVYKSEQSGVFTFFTPHVLTEELSYTDNVVSALKTYYYVVRARDIYGLHDSNIVEMSGIPVDTTDPTFSGLENIYGGDQKIKITWYYADDPTHPIEYNIYRSESGYSVGGDYFSTPIASISDTSYEDETVVNGTQYFYVVRAEDGSGNEESNLVELSIVPQTPPTDVIFVDSTSESGGDGTSWAEAFRYIFLALRDTDVGLGGSGNTTIWVAEGTYIPNSELVVPDSVEMYGGFEGTEISEADRDPLRYRTTIKIDSFYLENTIVMSDSSRLDGFHVSKKYSPFFEGNAVVIDGQAVKVQHNVIYESKKGIVLTDQGDCSSSKIYNNVFINNESGIVSDQGNAKIVNNTFQNNQTAVSINTTLKTYIYNNIFFECNQYGVINNSGNTEIELDYNAFYANTDNFYDVLPGDNNIYENPLFVDSGFDYHIKSGSPCINKATSEVDGELVPDEDIDGDYRETAAYDIGADELIAENPPSLSDNTFEILDDPIGFIRISCDVSDPLGESCRLRLMCQAGSATAPYIRATCVGPTAAVFPSAPSVNNDREYQVGTDYPSISTVPGVDNNISFLWDSGADIYFFKSSRVPRRDCRFKITVNNGASDETPPTTNIRDFDNSPVMIGEPQQTIGTENTVHCRAIPQATTFYFQCASNDLFTVNTQDSGWLNEASYRFTGLVPGMPASQYYYRVKARVVNTIYNEWEQSLRSNFDSNTPTNIDTLTSPGTVFLDTYYDDITGVVSDPSFEDNDSTWSTGYSGSFPISVSISDQWHSEGSYCLKICNNEPGTSSYYNGNHGYAAQTIDFDTIGKITFDAYMIIVNATSVNAVGQVLVGNTVVWEKSVGQVYLDQEIDVSDFSGNKSLKFSLVFKQDCSTYADTNRYTMCFDNIRTRTRKKYYFNGTMVTSVIAPDPIVKWNTLTYSAMELPNTSITVDVLDDLDNVLLADVSDVTSLDGVLAAGTDIKLRLSMSSTSYSVSPEFYDWKLVWTEDDNDCIDSEFATQISTSYQDVDTDCDGMPDTYEDSTAGLDPNVADGHLDNDNDGETNYYEYITGTELDNETDYFDFEFDLEAEEGITTVTLTFDTKDDVYRYYEAYYSDDSLVWNKFGETVRGNGQTIVIIDTDEDKELPYEKRLYKIKVILDN